MVSRFAEIVGALAIIVVGFTAIGALTYESATQSRSEHGPVLHSGLGVVSTALEDGYTAQLALAQFPLPIPKTVSDDTGRQLVEAIQRELAQRGFDVGPADGMVHPETRAAIRDYEATSGLDVTGVPTQNLLGHIRLTRAVGDAVVSTAQQEKRELILRVQRRLTELGYDSGPIGGAVTPKTREAIAAFEVERGLPQTGDLSPRLVKELGSEGSFIQF